MRVRVPPRVRWVSDKTNLVITTKVTPWRSIMALGFDMQNGKVPGDEVGLDLNWVTRFAPWGQLGDSVVLGVPSVLFHVPLWRASWSGNTCHLWTFPNRRRV